MPINPNDKLTIELTAGECNLVAVLLQEAARLLSEKIIIQGQAQQAQILQAHQGRGNSANMPEGNGSVSDLVPPA